MTQFEFEKLSADLRTIASKIPLHWGAVQNNSTDDRIDMFSLQSYEELESAVSRLSEESANYLRRRWYLWKCAECDEYLFYKNEGVIKNPDKYDKAWDICIDEEYYFDVKGTVIPRSFRGGNLDFGINGMGNDIIKFFYDEQSRGRRFDMQNRLFIVHHSFVDEKREFYLRCAWQTKEYVYKMFVDNISSVYKYVYRGCTAALVYLIEEEKGKIVPFIPGLKLTV